MARRFEACQCRPFRGAIAASTANEGAGSTTALVKSFRELTRDENKLFPKCQSDFLLAMFLFIGILASMPMVKRDVRRLRS